MSENLAEDENWSFSSVADVQYVISQSTFAIWQFLFARDLRIQWAYSELLNITP